MSGETASRAPEARLACSGVTVRFGGLAAVQDADLVVPTDEIVGLVGPNGAGKTTLFGVLSGLLRPSTGQVWLDGVDVTDARPQARAARGLARTFQHPELFAGLSVRDHLVLAYRAKHSRRRVWSDLLTMGSLRPVDAQERRAVDELIELLGLGNVGRRPASGLPLGVARMLELGRALAASPTVVLLDEPSSGLDPSETAQFESTLRSVARERGIAVLLVEHDVDLVMRMCSTVYVLDFGRLIAGGTPAEVRANPVVRSAYLGEELTGDDDLAGDGELTGDDGVTGATVSTAGARGAERARSGPAGGSDPRRGDGTPILAVKDLRVRYGEATALGSVSFSLGAGRALAILGANGAGKSSLARAISGLVPACGGSVALAGEQIADWPAHRIRRAGLVHLPEGRGVFRGLTVLDNLRMAAGAVHGRQARRDALARAYEVFPFLADRRRQVAGLLSGGEQQMLSLARAFTTSPQLLVADELSLGLAPKAVDLVFEGLARALQMGVSVIMIEQYVHRALAFADDCLVLERGEVAWNGPAHEAGDEVLRHYLGEAMTAAS